MSVQLSLPIAKKDSKSELLDTGIQRLKGLFKSKQSLSDTFSLSSDLFILLQHGYQKQLLEVIEKGFYEQCQKILILLRECPSKQYAHQFIVYWKDYYDKIIDIEIVCSTLSRSLFMFTNNEYHSLKEIGIKLFYEMIYNNDPSCIIHYIPMLLYHTENIKPEYFSDSSLISLDIDSLSSSMDILNDLKHLELFYSECNRYLPHLDLYNNIYINTIIQMKRNLYSHVFQYTSQSQNSIQFFSHIYEFIQKETQLLIELISIERSRHQVLDLLYKLLLFGHENQPFEFENGYIWMYNHQNYQILQFIDQLYMYNERGRYLYKEMNTQYLQQHCYHIFTNSKNPVPGFFQFLTQMRAIYKKYFHENELLYNSIFETKTKLVNRYPLVLDTLQYYFHQCIIQGDSEKIKEFRTEMDSVYVNILDKDSLMNYYKCYLLYRYFYTSFNINSESKLFNSLNSLVPFSNFHFVSYLLKDINNKKTINKSIQKYNTKKHIQIQSPISLTLLNNEFFNAFELKQEDNQSNIQNTLMNPIEHYINTSHYIHLYLPSLDIYNHSNSILPESLLSDLKQLEESYNSLYIYKRCSIFQNYLQMKIKANYGSQEYTILCTHYQGTAFLLVNQYLSQKKNQNCSLSELYTNIIQENMKIEMNLFLCILKSFLNPISFYIITEKNISKLNSKGQIKLSYSIQSKNETIYIPPLSMEEIQDSSTQDSISDKQTKIEANEDQLYLSNNINTILDALIVKHLKLKKTIQYQDLKDYVTQQYFSIYHGPPFDLDEHIKREIDVLIDREFIIRDDDDEDILEYLE